MTSKQRQILFQISILTVTLLASLALFTVSYRYDNKYTASTVQPMNGILFFTPDQGPIHLTNGWEYYRGRLLSPEDWQTDPPSPDGCLAIGQYPGMEAGVPNASPHGSITYRLTLCLPETPASYTLELPEIYSAYRLYLNGRLAASQGNPDPDSYVPALKSGTLTFEGSGDMTLLLAVSDWSHLYSGLVYPPAFGPSDAVCTLLDQKFVWGLAAVALALTLGLFQLVLSVLLESRRSLYSGLICVSFAVSVSSPVLHRLITTGIVPFYNLEIFCRYAMYGLAALLVANLCRETGEIHRRETGEIRRRETGEIRRRVQTAVTLAAAAFPFAALAVSLMAPGLTRDQMLLFSHAAGAYKILCSLWLLGTVFYAGLRREQKLDTAVLLAGVCAFASSLAADRLYPGFEPIRFGWFSETAGLLFVLLVSFLMLRDSAVLYRQQFLFTQQKKQLEDQIIMQKKHYGELAGQIEAVRTVRHDVRHHLNQLAVLLDDGENSAAREYISRLTDSSLTASPLSFCDAYYVDVLLRFYDAKAKEQRVPFDVDVHIPADPCIPEEDLCVILGNLLENSLEANQTVPAAFRRMSVIMSFENQTLAIEVKNPFTGRLIPDGDGFYSTKDPGRRGIGLSSTKDPGRRGIGPSSTKDPGRRDIGLSSTKDPGRRGIGLSSVRSLTEKYGGGLWIRTQPGENGLNIFTVQALLTAPADARHLQ